MLPQPNETSCGPTCLHAVYRYFKDDVSLGQVIQECETLQGGGTLAVMLGAHALERGYEAVLYAYNLRVFDPTWFRFDQEQLRAKLISFERSRHRGKLRDATRAYRRFVERGGELRFEHLTPRLIRKHISRKDPILTGLSSTYLYQEKRINQHGAYDDMGSPEGHFVVLCGYDPARRRIQVADPWPAALGRDSLHYWVDIDRLVNAILLGVLTYDANLLVISPRRSR